MQFDTIIIGGGLSGLVCGIRLLEQGQKCALISTGQSALHFSSGSLDLLNALPDGSSVQHPIQSLNALAEQAPQHPYSLLGQSKVEQLAQQAEQLLQQSNVALKGHYTENHIRLTPFGISKPSWLSAEEVPTYSFGQALPWKNIAIISIEGFLDFQPELAADVLKQQGATVTTDYLQLPCLDRLRANPSEFRAINIARILDLTENQNQLAHNIAALSQHAEVIILPAVIGLNDASLIKQLSKKVGKPIMLVPTLPPSLLGIRIYQQLLQRFQKMGGVSMPGDTVLRAELDEQNVKAIYTHNHTNIALTADNFVLASGSFFSNGLRSELNCVTEPVFNLDIISKANRMDWNDTNLFNTHPYLQFGVKTDQQLRGLVNGFPLRNLYAIGAILSGYDPIQQGCGAGVALISALHVANAIIQSKEVM